MALDRWSNTGLSALVADISSATAVFSVVADTGSRFPSQDFQLVIWNVTQFANPIDDPGREIVRCTARSGDVLTVSRGQEDTTGVAHLAGSAVALILTQKFRDDLQDLLTDFFATGRRLVFDHSTPPTGWTRDATLDDRVLLIGTGATIGGGWSAALGDGPTANNVAIASDVVKNGGVLSITTGGAGSFTVAAQNLDPAWRPLHRTIIIASKDAP